jgi:hypothetical protein
MSNSTNDITINHQMILPQTAAPVQGQDAAEMQQLPELIKSWRDLQKETDELTEQVKERKKRLKVMDEMILRIMKKNNIGAVDLQHSGGRLLYRRQTSKGSLGQKDLTRLLAEHLKSEQKAAEALAYVAEHRGSKVKESLLYEKD